jgi:hypothetical protein
MDDDGAFSVVHVVMAAIAEGELLGPPAPAEGDRFALDDGDLGSGVAVFLISFVVMLGHFGVRPILLTEFDDKFTQRIYFSANLLIFA